MPSVLPAVPVSGGACPTRIAEVAHIGQNHICQNHIGQNMPIRTVPSVITISDSGNPSRQ
jgi:hypothetical protein